ncbi:Multi-sensor signal transduction histidine kinase [Candidatus Magnetoovum chiemensis]|nr:Multi-sensor signal transduction histidine kinase [Candidatus Magnetoovum chiemensis]
MSASIIKKIRALILFRVLITYILLAVFFFHGKYFTIFHYPQYINYLSVFIFLITIIYLLILKRLKSGFYVFAYFQIAFDVIIIVAIILITGGVESWFSFLLLLNIIGSGIVLGSRSVMIFASLSTIAYGVSIDLQYYSIIPISYSATLNFRDFIYNIFTNITAMFLTAYLSRNLLLGIERTSATLQKAETSIKDLRAFHKEIIENIPSGLIYTDTYGNILLFNRSAEHITNIDKTRANEKTIKNIFPFIEELSVMKKFKGFLNKDDCKKTIELNITEHLNSDNKIIGYIATFTNITRIEEMERDIKQKEKLAAIGELSANIAHEIRNPLAALRTSVEMLRESDKNKDRNKKIMDIALHEMDRLNKIITDFLMYSNPRPPNFKRISLTRVLNETVYLVRASISAASDISIEHSIEDGIVIKADEDKIKQVFWNLSLNAVQALENKGAISITMNKNRSSRSAVSIVFKDNGIGIKPDDMEKIFYPFFTTKKEGSGLGLATVYRIVNEHSGIIKVHSKVNEGTVFEIILPEEQ